MPDDRAMAELERIRHLRERISEIRRAVGASPPQFRKRVAIRSCLTLASGCASLATRCALMALFVHPGPRSRTAQRSAPRSRPGAGLAQPTRADPPVGACFLLDLLLAKADRDVIPGDLEEDFGSDLSKYGAGYARFLFWTRTLGAIAWRNPVCRWALVSGLARLADWF
jgi:hypothetical protein